MRCLSTDGENLVDVHIRKGNEACGLTPVFAVDEKGNLLNTEPLCIINKRYFPWFYDWLKTKFEEEEEEEEAEKRRGRFKCSRKF